MSRLSLSTLGIIGCLVVAACGGSGAEQAPRAPKPPPKVVLTAQEKKIWAHPPPGGSAVPVLLYHGIAPESDYANETDASYGVNPEDFAKQMTLLKHAGYQTITLDQFDRFTRGASVKLPPHPLLLTMDDALASSWTGGDGILRKLGFSAVLFVDVGHVDEGDSAYLTWTELQTAERSGRWQLQLHSGHGHRQIRYGRGSDDYGAFYAYEEVGESFDQWLDRTFSDITWGRQQLAAHIPGYRPLAFAPPYGNYGQDGTNDPEIPPTLLGWLKKRFDLIFTQDRSAFAHPGQRQPLGRIQVTRSTTGGQLHAMLTSGH